MHANEMWWRWNCWIYIAYIDKYREIKKITKLCFAKLTKVNKVPWMHFRDYYIYEYLVALNLCYNFHVTLVVPWSVHWFFRQLDVIRHNLNEFHYSWSEWHYRKCYILSRIYTGLRLRWCDLFLHGIHVRVENYSAQFYVGEGLSVLVSGFIDSNEMKRAGR